MSGQAAADRLSDTPRIGSVSTGVLHQTLSNNQNGWPLATYLRPEYPAHFEQIANYDIRSQAFAEARPGGYVPHRQMLNVSDESDANRRFDVRSSNSMRTHRSTGGSLTGDTKCVYGTFVARCRTALMRKGDQ